MKLLISIVLSAFVVAFGGCSRKKSESRVRQPDLIGYTLQRTWPHDVKAFTQGLVIHKGQLYESTGESDSWIGVVNVNTGIAEKKVDHQGKYFGEGITVLNNKLYHITWKSRTGFVYQLPDFGTIKTFEYPTEGWGLTHNGIDLIMSDGTDRLYFRDSLSLEVKRTLKVTYKGAPLDKLNELEFIDGYVFANIWQTNRIARIDPATGVVDAFLDLSQLAAQARVINAQVDVLNGIAWHETSRLLLVTGKYWPLIYILKLGDVLQTQP
jgi:glutamine cyclotransferase